MSVSNPGSILNINDPTIAGNTARVGEASSLGGTDNLHVTVKPIPTSIGHYRVTHRFVLLAAQAANSKLFEIRMPTAGRLIIPTRFFVKWLTRNAHTAIIEDSLDVYKLTGFTAVDTVNTVTLVGVVKKTTGMGASTAEIRGVTVAGAAAGMTGGTHNILINPVVQHPIILPLTVMATTDTQPRYPNVADLLNQDVNHEHPFALEQNEGIVMTNRVLLGAAAGSSVYVDFSWAEALAF